MATLLRANIIRRFVLSTRGFASVAEPSPIVIQVVMDLQKMHIASLERMQDENKAFRNDIKGQLTKMEDTLTNMEKTIGGKISSLEKAQTNMEKTIGGKISSLETEQTKLNNFVRWSVGAVSVVGVTTASLKYFL